MRPGWSIGPVFLQKSAVVSAAPGSSRLRPSVVPKFFFSFRATPTGDSFDSLSYTDFLDGTFLGLRGSSKRKNELEPPEKRGQEWIWELWEKRTLNRRVLAPYDHPQKRKAAGAGEIQNPKKPLRRRVREKAALYSKRRIGHPRGIATRVNTAPTPTMASVMSAAVSKAAVFTGARASTRGTTRVVRCSAVPAVQIGAAKSIVGARSTNPKRAGVVSLTAPIVAPAAIKRGATIAPKAGGGGPCRRGHRRGGRPLRHDRGRPEEALVDDLRPLLRLRPLQLGQGEHVRRDRSHGGVLRVDVRGEGPRSERLLLGLRLHADPRRLARAEVRRQVRPLRRRHPLVLRDAIAPACAQWSFTALLVSRFLVGLGEGVAPPPPRACSRRASPALSAPRR